MTGAAVAERETIGAKVARLERRADALISDGRPILRACDVVTPVYRNQLSFAAGGVVKFRGPMKCGKTRLMISKTYQLLDCGYHGNEVYANCWLDIPGAHWLSNDEWRTLIRRAFNTEAGAGRWNHTIWLGMETDDIWSHIKQSDQMCFEDIRKASQVCKRNQYLFYEMHDGLGVPKYLRDKTEISVKPLRVDGATDTLHYLVCNGAYEVNYTDWVSPISWVNDKYRRFDELW